MPQIRSLLTGRPVLTLPETASALDAAREMARSKVGAVLVLDDARGPLGIFTERDLMLRVVVPGRAPESVQLSDVMSRDVYSTHPDQKIAEARQEMQRRHIRHLPIVEAGRVICLLSLRDLLRADLEQCSTEVHELQRYIHGTEDLPPPP